MLPHIKNPLFSTLVINAVINVDVIGLTQTAKGSDQNAHVHLPQPQVGPT